MFSDNYMNAFKIGLKKTLLYEFVVYKTLGMGLRNQKRVIVLRKSRT